MSSPRAVPLNEAFASFLTLNHPDAQIQKVARILATEDITRENVLQLRPRVLLSKSARFRTYLVGLALLYARACVRDHVLLPQEKDAIRLLNILFQIEDGEYYKRQRDELSEVLSQQALWMVQDAKIDTIEDLFQSDLQRIFSLGTDQFAELTRPAVIAFLDTIPEDKTNDWREAIRKIKTAYLISSED